MVGSSCSPDSHTSTNTVLAGGSSMSFSSLFWAGSRVLLPKNNRYTLTSASSGIRYASAVMERTVSTLRERVTPLPSSIRISGCDPASARIQEGHVPQGTRSFSLHTSALASSLAKVRFPQPFSPCKRIAWGKRPEAKAADSASFTSSLPKKPKKSIIPFRNGPHSSQR